MANILGNNLFGLTSWSNAQKSGAGPVATAAQDPAPGTEDVFKQQKRLSALDTAFYSKAQLDELKISPIAEALADSEAASQVFERLDPRARLHLAELVSTRLMTVDEVVGALRGMAKEAVMTSDTILLDKENADTLLGVDEDGKLKIPAEDLWKRDSDQYWTLRTEGLKSLNDLNLFADEADSELTSAKDMADLEKLTRYLKHPPDMKRLFEQAQKAYLDGLEELGDIPPRGYLTVSFESYFTPVKGKPAPPDSSQYLAELGRASDFLKQLEEISRKNTETHAKRAMSGPVVIRDE